jgi:hypothetical protein
MQFAETKCLLLCDYKDKKLGNGAFQLAEGGAFGTLIYQFTINLFIALLFIGSRPPLFWQAVAR